MSHAASNDLVVEVRDLTRRFGRSTALDRVSLAVPRGCVLGLVGVNGSGKTTLIKHVLGLLQAQSGSVRVFGLDPVAKPVEVLSRIGYLSEDCDLPSWMRVGELLRYTGSFHATWDAAYALELCKQFGLDQPLPVQLECVSGAAGSAAADGAAAAGIQACRVQVSSVDQRSAGRARGSAPPRIERFESG